MTGGMTYCRCHPDFEFYSLTPDPIALFYTNSTLLVTYIDTLTLSRSIQRRCMCEHLMIEHSSLHTLHLHRKHESLYCPATAHQSMLWSHCPGTVLNSLKWWKINIQSSELGARGMNGGLINGAACTPSISRIHELLASYPHFIHPIPSTPHPILTERIIIDI